MRRLFSISYGVLAGLMDNLSGNFQKCLYKYLLYNCIDEYDSEAAMHYEDKGSVICEGHLTWLFFCVDMICLSEMTAKQFCS